MVNVNKARKLIEFDYVSKQFDKCVAIKDFSLSICSEEIIGILGPNGAGKTTLLKMLCSLTFPTSGNISIEGKSLKKQKNILSCVLEGNRNLYQNLSVIENIEFLLGIKGIKLSKKMEELHHLLKMFSMTDKKGALIQELSRGMQQKVALMITLLDDSKIILLDEPTLGLDMESLKEIQSYLRTIFMQFNKTLIITSHDMKFIDEVCSRVVILKQGEKIYDESKKNIHALLTNNKIYRITYEKDLVLQESCSYSFDEYKKNYADLNISSDIKDIDVSAYTLEDLFLELTRMEESVLI